MGGRGRADPAIVEELYSLVSKSLCEASEIDTDAMRLLETIRAYTLEKLAQNGEYPDAARGMPRISAISSLPWRPPRAPG